MDIHKLLSEVFKNFLSTFLSRIIIFENRPQHQDASVHDEIPKHGAFHAELYRGQGSHFLKHIILVYFCCINQPSESVCFGLLIDSVMDPTADEQPSWLLITIYFFFKVFNQWHRNWHTENVHTFVTQYWKPSSAYFCCVVSSKNSMHPPSISVISSKALWTFACLVSVNCPSLI